MVSELKWFQLFNWAILVLYFTDSAQRVSPDLTLTDVCEAGFAGVTEVVGVVLAELFEPPEFVEEAEPVSKSFWPMYGGLPTI